MHTRSRVANGNNASAAADHPAADGAGHHLAGRAGPERVPGQLPGREQPLSGLTSAHRWPNLGGVTGPPGRLADAVRRPLPLAYHPLYRFYEGGSMTRAFRGLPGRPDDRWSEDWVGSCTPAGNSDPDGRAQGISPVELPGGGT